jgi:hypothetical protein
MNAAAAHPDHSGPAVPVRATQSLIGVIQWCSHHLSLLGYELLWRWIFGIPVLWICWQQALHVWALVPPEQWTQLQLVQGDPVKASAVLAMLWESLLPTILGILRWLVPTLIVAWSIVSGLGRWLVLRRLAALQPEWLPPQRLRGHAGRLIIFQAARILGLVAACVTVCFCIRAGADSAFADPDNPNLVLYFVVVIVSGLGVFTLWALLSWAVTVAPLLSLLEGQGVIASLHSSWRLGKTLTSKLIEVNLVLGIIKLALLVLAMVFSAIPLPFESATTPQQLHVWWAIVTVAYFVANDFFQIARLVALLKLIQTLRHSQLTD